MKVFGTTVKNPSTRAGQYGYTECTHCHKMYTRLGISRHWDKCPKRPVKEDLVQVNGKAA
jgi:PHP family Zn ribbon phosphoesterase